MTAIRTRPQDTESENEVARIIEQAWGCVCHRYAFLDGIEWWLERDQRCVGFAELKTRSHAFGTYPTVWLAFRKWTALQLASMTGPRSVFVVRFLDGVRWVRVDDIDARRLTIGARLDRPDMPNDREPIIEVPVEQLRVLA